MMPLKKTADSLKKKGVQIIPVGFGRDTLNIGSLMDMASDEDFIFNMDFIPEFIDAMGRISKIKCSGTFMYGAPRLGHKRGMMQNATRCKIFKVIYGLLVSSSFILL